MQPSSIDNRQIDLITVMSATEVTALPEVEKKEVKMKPDRPDEDLYRATEAKLKKEHEEALAKHVCLLSPRIELKNG